MAKFITATTGTATGKIGQRFAKILFTFVYTGSVAEATVLAALRALKIKVTKSHPSYGQQEIWKDGFLFKRLEGMAHLQSAINMTAAGGNTTVKASFICVDEMEGGSIEPMSDETYEFEITAIPAEVTVQANYIEWQGKARNIYTSNFTFIGADVPTTVNVAGAKLLIIDRANFGTVELRNAEGKSIVLTGEEISDLMDDHRPLAYLKYGLGFPGGEEVYILDVDNFTIASVTRTANGKVETFSFIPVK
jgi:hypothetical protein